MDLELEGAMLSDRGCSREVNEDCAAYVLPRREDPRHALGALALVADGMGGHAAGEVASHLAAEVVVHSYYAQPGPRQTALRAALGRANAAVLARAHTAKELHGMGTTCTALAIQDGQAYLAHVGDSRLYFLRDSSLTQLSEDHSLVGELVRLGRLTKAEARTHPDRNVIVRALGTKPEVQVASWTGGLEVRPGDCFCLCSDGLTDVVEDEAITEEMARDDPWAACECLIALALKANAPDNVTVGVFRVVEPERREKRTARPTRDLVLTGAHR